MRILKEIKRSFDDWCAKMGKSNRESFGGGVPDCCKLNQKQSHPGR